MSYQSRSRAKSISDVSTFSDGNGKCCFGDGTSSVKNYYECLKLNGAFFIDVDAQCPEIGNTGCCCSCSGVESYVVENGEYIFTGGLRVTTQCTCEEECGVFHDGIACEDISDITIGCQKPTADGTNYDVRYPYGCCYPSVNDDGEVTGWADCVNVCTSQDCLNLAPENLTTFCPNIYYGINCDGTEQVGSGRMCDFVHPVWDGVAVNCNANSCSSGDCEDGEAIGACCLLDIPSETTWCDEITETQCAAHEDDETLSCWGGCGEHGCDDTPCPELPDEGLEGWCPDGYQGTG